MIEIKVRLSFEVPGATMLSSQECDKNPKEGYNLFKIAVTDKGQRDILNIRTRKTRPARQSISISREAYEAMLKDKPKDVPMKEWKKLGNHAKLAAHMQLIAESLGGMNPEFEIFED